MSYDVYVDCHTCGSDLIRPWGNNNMTSNLAPMWNDAGAPLRDFNGMAAMAVMPKLQAALDSLRDDPEHYRTMNPANGWGRYEDCVEFLERILAACARDPHATVRISH
jgi:hypothetical protein